MRLLFTTLALGLLLLPSLSFANDAAVLQLLEQKCASCHKEDEPPVLHGGINLTSLRGDEDMLKSIVDRVGRPDESRGRMPKSKGKPGDPAYLPPLSKEELALIQSLASPAAASPAPPATSAAPAPAPPVTTVPASPGAAPVGEGTKPAPTPPALVSLPPRVFVPMASEVRMIAEDLAKLPAAAQPFARYLTLTNLANLRGIDGQPTEDETQLATYRAAISKLLNSLSHEGVISVPVPVDEGKTIYRFDLRHYGWTREEWEKFVVSAYPYALRGYDARREDEIATLSHSAAAWVRADWFVFAASQPPLYHQLLRLPANDRELEKELGVDVVGNLKTDRALRAGFRESGVSQGNRMIERHELGRYAGAYWKSYDFSPLKRDGGHDLFRSPLGPVGAGLTSNKDREFVHDGGEIIWNLRNGLQAYYLSTAAGVRLDRAPTEIVQDRKRRDGAILNGISCMACHDQGMKYMLDRPLEKFLDEVGPIALKAGLDREEQRSITGLYVDQARLHEAVLADEARFKAALAAAMPGYDQPLDPVVRLYNRFKSDIRLETLAAEFGEEDASFLKRLRESRDADLESIAVQLEAGMGFPRASFLDQFAKITQALGFRQLQFVPLAYAEFTGTPAPQAGGNEGRVALSDGGRLTISTDKAHYVKGDLLKVTLKCTEGVHVRLYHFSAEKKLTQIFPNQKRPDNFVKGGETVTFPAVGDRFAFRMGEPFGTEIILAVASPVQFTDEENLRFAANELFKSFDEKDLRVAERRGTKGLTVEDLDVTGAVQGELAAPTFVARAVFTVGPK